MALAAAVWNADGFPWAEGSACLGTAAAGQRQLPQINARPMTNTKAAACEFYINKSIHLECTAVCSAQIPCKT